MKTIAPTIQDMQLQMATQRQTMERLSAQHQQMQVSQMCLAAVAQQQQLEQAGAMMRQMQARGDYFQPCMGMDSDIMQLSNLGRSMAPAPFVPFPSGLDPFAGVSHGRNAPWGASCVTFGGDAFGGYQNGNFEYDDFQEGYGSW